jgi:RNA polymerase sigma factor (sigma-70 family)
VEREPSDPRDPRAASTLIESHRPLAVYLASRARLPRSVERDDAVGVAYLALARAVDGWRESGGTNLPNWIRLHVTTALFHMQRDAAPFGNRRRAEGDRAVVVSLAALPGRGEWVADPGPSTHAQVEGRLFRLAVREAMEGLTELERLLCRLVLLEERRPRDVAPALGKGEQAVSSALHDARKKLRVALAEWQS